MMERARSFMLRNARPIDFARWAYHFEGGCREDVLRALAAYQNTDGGFGHALEADCFNPDSSLIQTWAATEILREIGMDDAAHPVVTGIVRYLASGAAFDGHLWHRTVPGNDLHPHAPWWSHGPHPEDEYNPTAALAGFLVRFAPQGSEAHALGVRLAKEAYAYFAAHAPLGDMHTAACFLGLYEDLRAVDARELIDMDAFAALLARQIDVLIEKDTARWATHYVCKPSQLLRPGGEFAQELRGLARTEAGFIRDTQQEDGAWAVTWAWGAYPEEWAMAKNWWRADIVVKNLRFLRNVCGEKL